MINPMPSSAINSWADMASVDPSHGPFVVVILLFVQLVGLVAVGGGLLKINRYVTPGHPKAPPTLSLPIIQVLAGLFALVPERVYNFTIDVLKSMGWF